MKDTVHVSSQFAALVKELQSAPNNPVLQKNLLNCLPQMKLLAKSDPMVLFLLAKIYPPNSAEYKNAIRQSANQGCTNAMLEMCQILVKSDHLADLKTAAHFMKKINDAKDSHIISLSKQLLADNPQLEKLMRDPVTPRLHSFFKMPVMCDEQLEMKKVSTSYP